MENKKLFQYIAGGCFALVAVINIITFLSGYADTITYISQIGYILIAVGIFIYKPLLSTVGGGILTLYQTSCRTGFSSINSQILHSASQHTACK